MWGELLQQLKKQHSRSRKICKHPHCSKMSKERKNSMKQIQGHPTQTGFFEAGENKMDMGQFYSVGWTMSIHRPLELQTADWPGKFGNLNMRKDIKKSHLQKSWKNWRVWLKNYSCPSHLYFELKMAGNRTILQLKKNSKISNHKKFILVGVSFQKFCSKFSRYWTIIKNVST